METRAGGVRRENDGRTLGRLCGLLLAILAIWNVREVLEFDFVARDDDINIYYNPHLGPPGAASVEWMFTDLAYMRRYVPLGWLAFSNVYAVSGLSPVGYHATNLAFHAANTVLVYLLLAGLLRRFASGAGVFSNISLAALGAALWSLNPFRAETIGWASGLLYGAASFWALASACAYVQTAACSSSPRRRTAWLVLAWISYALSILTYPIAIALPVAFVAMDLAPGTRSETIRRLCVEKLGFVIPGAAVLALTVFARFEPSEFWPAAPSWAALPLSDRIAQGAAVWAHYLWHIWWPVDLRPAPTWLLEIDPLAPRFALSIAAIAGITLVLFLKQSWRGALLIWATYLGILVPVLGVTERPHFASDRYAYLASVVLVAAVALGLARLAARWRIVLGATLAVVCALWGGLQRSQVRIWRDTDALFGHELVLRPDSHAGDADFVTDTFRRWAMFHAHRGNFARAWEILTIGEKRAAGHPRIEAMRRELTSLTTSTDSNPGEKAPLAALLHARMAMDFARAHRTREAHEHFEAARKLAPASATIAFNWAIFSALQGETPRALQLYYRSIANAPRHEIGPESQAKLFSLIAQAYAGSGRGDLAKHASEQASKFQAQPTSAR